MGKLNNLLSRMGSMSFKRMNQYIDQIHDQYGQNKVLTFVDMIYCLARYGTGYLDYTVFGYARIKGKNRGTFVNNEMNRKISAMSNDVNYTHFLKNKLDFCEKYSDFIGRDYLDLNKASADDFENFVKQHGQVFVKCPCSFGGQGVKSIKPSDIGNFEELYNTLKADSYTLIEEKIEQHPVMNELCPRCINSLRVVTLRGSDGKFNYMYSLLRMGKGNKDVDNITSGGMYILLDENGKSISKAFCDKTGEYYEKHPMTSVDLLNFEVPMHDKAIELCLKAAEVTPEIGYVGWDVAITPDGPVLIEGNVLPGYDMCQNATLSGRDHGLLGKFRSIPGFENIK